ncbi:hypothetical protein PENTCL1PPCAC_4163 [Pristionchus entomophagus]|uniref:Uncharacterized protein n=1 Tax=Pristionchus entomophagus TaxID=358040 RepID=A0AAV5SMX7_9BILA|nr:hypothetical protein PENTCL1PPCAC_4163 [Pristionchus entomophagus]
MYAPIVLLSLVGASSAFLFGGSGGCGGCGGGCGAPPPCAPPAGGCGGGAIGYVAPAPSYGKDRGPIGGGGGGYAVAPAPAPFLGGGGFAPQAAPVFAPAPAFGESSVKSLWQANAIAVSIVTVTFSGGQSYAAPQTAPVFAPAPSFAGGQQQSYAAPAGNSYAGRK